MEEAYVQYTSEQQPADEQCNSPSELPAGKNGEGFFLATSVALFPEKKTRKYLNLHSEWSLQWIFLNSKLGKN